MPNFVCQHSAMVDTTLKPHAFAFIVSNIQHVLGNPALFFSARKHLANISGHARIPPDCVRLAEKLVLVAFRLFPSDPFDFMPLSAACVASSVPTWWLCGPIGACAARLSPAKIFVLLWSSLLMLSGEIYLRLKPYLVVKISSGIVTEHCCQVCVLSMMFCRSDCRLCADMVSDCAIKLVPGERTMWFDLTC